jgi:hypothetical protein
MGVEYKNRAELIENLHRLFDNYIEIETIRTDERGRRYKGKVKIKMLSMLGLLDKDGKEVANNDNYIKRIIVKYDTLIVDGLRGRGEVYKRPQIELFSHYRKELNLRQMKILFQLIAETGDTKKIPDTDLSQIYNFAKTGTKILNDDIQILKDKQLLDDKSVVKKYKQHKNRIYFYAVKGQRLKELTGVSAQASLNIGKVESSNIQDEQAIIDTSKILDRIKKLKAKRGFTLDQLVVKLNSCFDELLANESISPAEASQYKIKDKGMLGRRLSGERQFTEVEIRTIERLLELY